MHLIVPDPCSKTKQWRTGLTFVLQHCWFLSPAAKLSNKQLDLLSCRSANLLGSTTAIFNAFILRQHFFLVDSKIDGLWKEIFVPLFIFKQLGNNVETTEQIHILQTSLKWVKLKAYNWCSKQFQKYWKCWHWRQCPFPTKQEILTWPNLKRCGVFSVLLNKTCLNYSSNQVFSEKVTGQMAQTIFLYTMPVWKMTLFSLSAAYQVAKITV